MSTIPGRSVSLLLMLWASGCCLPSSGGDEGGGTSTPLGPKSGARFVNRGTAELIDNGGPCLVWRGQDGITYHLFQSMGLGNEVFDTITTPGVTSRLEIRVRTDLVVACQVGTIVEVLSVLEIVQPEA